MISMPANASSERLIEASTFVPTQFGLNAGLSWIAILTVLASTFMSFLRALQNYSSKARALAARLLILQRKGHPQAVEKVREDK